MVLLIEQIRYDVHVALADEKKCLGQTFAKIEQHCHCGRDKCFWLLAACLTVYLTVGRFAELICNLICVVYPVYMSLLAIELRDGGENAQWLTYWIFFALFTIVDYSSDLVMAFLPVYWLLKCVLFLWLSVPMYKGAARVYQSLLQFVVVNYIAPSKWKLW
uniref:Receptor expression-enhancing protein n=1 Tax=Trichuris muris TaxID=70415 RepID=A0A5S6QXG0_TRIMR